MSQFVYRVTVAHYWDVGINADSLEDAANVAASIKTDLTQTDTLTNKIHRTLRRFAGGAILLNGNEISYRHVEKGEQGKVR